MLTWHFDTLDSTNDRARELGASHPHAPVLVVAEQQTRGRGRTGRGWHSPRGGAWFSLSWPVDESLDEAALGAAPLVAGLAVCDVVAYGIDDAPEPLQLKWPNDVLLGEAKLAGILCERVMDGSPRQAPSEPGAHDDFERQRIGRRVILGLGINANLQRDQLTGPFDTPATSLLEARGRPIDRIALIEKIAGQMLDHLQALQSGGLPEPMRQAIEHCLAWRNQSVCLTQGDRRIEGKVQGITQEGRLVMMTDQGRQTFEAGELRSLRGCRRSESGREPRP